MKRITIMISCTILVLGIFSFTEEYFLMSKNFETYTAVLKNISSFYVDDTEPTRLNKDYVDGMLKTIDPFTNYFSGSQIERARIQQEGKFGGIGVDFNIYEGYPVITAVEKGLPGDMAGIKPGDIIRIIDGKSTQGKNLDDVTQAMVGQPGTTLNLSIDRPSASGTFLPQQFNVKRQEIQETNVPFFGMIDENYGCIKLKVFNPEAGKDVKEAFDSLKKANPNLKGVILDLRGNPGGLLLEAVNIVNIWVPQGTLVTTTKGKVPEWNNSFVTKAEPSDTKIPIAVIIDSKSASASEIVSGALQDLDRAVVLGQQSYGKGLVQITRNLPYNTMLKVTCAKYYIPSGRCVQALDYAEKNLDGSVKRVADSLRVAFKTKAGRKVFDGGGVDPDVKVEVAPISAVMKTLQDKMVIFDYASQYALSNASVNDASAFKLTDDDFDKFVNFAKVKELDLSTDTEKLLKKLKERSKDENYFEALKNQIEAVESKISRDKETAIRSIKSELVPKIENEIVGRYFYAYGKIKKGYQNDKEIKEALALLKNQSRYQEILTVKK